MNAYFINLDHRMDRKEQIEQELSKLNIQATRFPGVQHSYGPVGCILAHLGVIKEAKRLNLPQVMIFEDDFELIVTPEAFWNCIAGIEPCDVFLFSYLGGKFSPHGNSVRAFDAQAPSGYIVYQRFYDTLISLYETNAGLLERTRKHWLHMNDQCWKPLQAEYIFYVAVPKCGRQRVSFSDNTRRVEFYT